MNPVSSEHHEQAVEAGVTALDVVAGHDDSFEYLETLARTALDAYFASLAEQGVRLVDLREVVEWLQNPRTISPDEADGASGRAWAAALERRFGSVSDGD